MCKSKVEEGICSECEKGRQIIEAPFGTKQKIMSHIYQMRINCINQFKLNLKKETDKGENNFTSTEDFRKVQEYFVASAESENK